MTDRKSKVSIIVPVYNVENYLKRCVDSLTRQSLAGIEILLIDDGSTDRSGELCDELAGTDLRISVYHKENEGQGIARNLGLQKATGTYVAFLDSDDYLPDASVMQRYVRMAEQTDADIVVANYARLWNGKMLPAVSHASFSRYHRDSQEFQFRGFFSAGTLSYVWGKLYRRSFLEKNQIRFAKYDYAEDKFFNMQCYLCRAKYIFLSRIGYIYRKNETSISSRYRANSSECWIAMARDLKEWMSDHEIQMESCEELVWYLIFFAIFFDAKMDYMQHKNSLRAVRKTLKKYGTNPVGKRVFHELADRKRHLYINQRMWEIMIRTFSFGMKQQWYILLAVGIKMLNTQRVDERLSDTGVRE